MRRTPSRHGGGRLRNGGCGMPCVISKSGLIAFFAKKVIPLETVAKPPVAVIVSPQLPKAVPPPRIENVAAKAPVLVKKVDDLSARCRILLNEAQREIDRLRRSMATPIVPQVPPEKVECPCESPASPPMERKTYAVDPIGTVPPMREDAPPRVMGEQIVVQPHVTNVGSLLDVLI